MDLADNISIALVPSTNLSLNSTDVNLVPPFSAVRSPFMFVTGGLFSCIGTVGNVLFILFFWLEKKLRSVSNYLISMLALADVLTILGFNLAYMLMVNRQSSASLCWYWLNSMPLFPIMSMYCQFLISIDRTSRVTQSNVTYTKWFSRKLTTLYVLVGWMVNVTPIVLFLGFGSPPDVPGERRCNSMKALSPSRERVVYILNGCFVIYCGMACACYGRLINYVRRRRITVTSIKQAYVRTSISLLILLIVAVFASIVSPLLFYISFTLTKNPRIYAIFDEVGASIFFLSYAINPVVYGYRIKMFREKLKSLFSLCLARIVGPRPVTDNNPGEDGCPSSSHRSQPWQGELSIIQSQITTLERRVVHHPVTDHNPGEDSSPSSSHRSQPWRGE